MKFLSKMIVVVFAFASLSIAQVGTTVYVNNTPGVGHDSNDGLSPATPKATITAAINEFPDGTTISVEGTDLLYNEDVVITDKSMTFVSTGADAPLVKSWEFNVDEGNVGADFEGEVYFEGDFEITNGITLTLGTVVAGEKLLTIGTSVTITEGEIDGQLGFTGTVDFTYDGTNNRTTAGELPEASNSTNFGALWLNLTDGDEVIKLNESKIMNGVLTIDDNCVLNLNKKTLTLQDGASPHDLNGNVIDGTLSLDLNEGAVSIASTGVGPGTLPNVSVFGDNDLTIEEAVSIGSLTASGDAGIIVQSVAAVTIDDALGTSDVVNSGTAGILFTGAGGVTVDGDVELSGIGTIRFEDAAASIAGDVINSATFTADDDDDNLAVISFDDFAHVIEGSVVLTGTVTVALNADDDACTDNKTVIFETVDSDTEIEGGISNACSVVSDDDTHINNGSVIFTLREAGEIGTVSGLGAVSNTAEISDDADVTCGMIDLKSNATGAVEGSSVASVGSQGGDVIFGIGDLTLTGSITNSRAKTSQILIGDGGAGDPTTTTAVSIGGGVTVSGKGEVIFQILDDNGSNGGVDYTITGALSLAGSGIIDFSEIITDADDPQTVAFGGLTMSGGTLDLSNDDNTIDITAGGNLNLTGGTLALGEGVRDLIFDGRNHTIGGATTNTTVTPTTNDCHTTLLFDTPSLDLTQFLTVGPAAPLWPGHLNINTGTDLTASFNISGGNLRVLGDVDFTDGIVNIDASKLIVGQHLSAPNGDGDFTNTAGYTTENNGQVSLNGFTQVLDAVAGKTYGGLEIDVLTTVTVNAAMTIEGNLYLTKGLVVNADNITLDNQEVYPTIIRNAGILDDVPTFASNINIKYIGTDKEASYEMNAGDPATDKLNDLTIATTNGATAGKGTVEVDVSALPSNDSFIVNGTLTVKANQALLFQNGNLVLAGDSASVNGILANGIATDMLVFDNATGTKVVGSGWLPDVVVNAGSVGNVINGPKGLIFAFLNGVDEVQDANDFDPTDTEATGSIDFENAAGNAALSVMFGSGADNGTHLLDITTNTEGDLLTIAGNLVQAGNMTHNNGEIAIAADVKWTHRGLTPYMDTDAAISGPGTLLFTAPDDDDNVLFTLNEDDVTIDAPVQVNMNEADDIFGLDPASNGGLILTNSFTFSKGAFQLGDDAAAIDLTLTGSNFYLDGNSSFLHYLADPDGDDIATEDDYVDGTLILAPDSLLTWEYEGSPTLGNVEVDGNVTLAGEDGEELIVYRNFTHTSGVLNFSDRNITIDGATANIDAAGVPGSQELGVAVFGHGDPGDEDLLALGSYTNVDGTYEATTGWLILRTADVNQGDNDFTIPNLRFGQGDDNISPDLTVDEGVVTVTKKFFMDILGGAEVTHEGQLAADSGVVVYYQNGTLDEAPDYAGSISLWAVNTDDREIDASVWPEDDELVSLFTVWTDMEDADAIFEVYLPGDRTVTSQIDLIYGDLLLTNNEATLTLANSTLRRSDKATLVEGDGSLVYENAPDIFYIPVTGEVVNVPTGDELPAVVNNLTFTRYSNVKNSEMLVMTAVTVNGSLNIKNNVEADAVISVLGDVNVTLDSEFAKATAPQMQFDAALAFVGPTDDQNINVPSGEWGFGSITLEKDAGNVILNGGDLNVGGVMNFVNGLFITNDNTLILNAVGGGVGLGFNYDVVSGGKSHVVGTVAIDPKMSAATAHARTEWPVGSMDYYRPVAMTILSAGGVNKLGQEIYISHEDSKPSGIVNLPIEHDGELIARYPNFYWAISSPDGSLSQLEFDLELAAAGFTQYGNIQETVIIRRQGGVNDVENEWSLQGVDYDNFVGDGVPYVLNQNSRGGIRRESAIFTYGMPTRLFTTAQLPDLTGENAIGLGASEAVTVDLAGIFGGNQGDLTYSVSATNDLVVEVPAEDFTEESFTVVGLVNGTTTIDVRATDVNGDFLTTSFNVEVDPTVALEDELGIPDEYQLAQNYPNPFNPTTNIRFGLPEAANVSLRIYNILGEEVATLVNSTELAAGFHTYNFDASRLSSGMYIYRIEAGNFVEVKKMLLLK